MRQALNENPKVQAGVVVVLLLLGVFMFMSMSKSEDAAPAGDPAAATSAGAVGATGDGVLPATGASGSTTAATSAAPAATPTASVTGAPPTAPSTATGTVSPEALLPGPGLPGDVVRSWAKGDAIVLLIVKKGATDDDLVRSSVNSISEPGVSVFVASADKVARYSRITQGVGVNRVPALIVVRPRSVSGSTPQAVVSYGFRNSQSVRQAVNDALYEGRDDVPYHPG